MDALRGGARVNNLSHFAVGVTVASCFPGAVRAAVAGNPAYMLLGGVCGVLPNILDRSSLSAPREIDVSVVLDPSRPDAATLADGFAFAVWRAVAAGTPVRVALCSVPANRQTWQRYTIRLDVRGCAVRAHLGPVVDAAGAAVRSPLHGTRGKAGASLPRGVRLGCAATTTVGVGAGAHFLVAPEEDGGARIRAVHPHRGCFHRWLPAGAVAVMLGFGVDLMAGAIAGLVTLTHALADGYVPAWVARRIAVREGAGSQRTDAPAGPAWPVVLCLWACGVVTWANLARALPGGAGMTLMQTLALAVGVPLGAIRLARYPWERRVRLRLPRTVRALRRWRD